MSRTPPRHLKTPSSSTSSARPARRRVWTGTDLRSSFLTSPNQGGGAPHATAEAARAPGSSQQAPPASTLKHASMSASVPTSPSLLKSALPHAAQQLPATHAKKISMSASVPTSPSLLKSAEQYVGAPALHEPRPCVASTRRERCGSNTMSTTGTLGIPGTRRHAAPSVLEVYSPASVPAYSVGVGERGSTCTVFTGTSGRFPSSVCHTPPAFVDRCTCGTPNAAPAR